MTTQFETTTTKVGALALGLLLFANIACSSKSSGSSETAAAASSLIVTASPTTISAGGTQVITPTGGSGSYTFVLVAGSVGSISQASGTYTVYTAPTTVGYATLIITDTAGATTTYPISSLSAVNGALSIAPLASSVALGGTLAFTVSGGNGSGYIYSVISPVGAGYFSGATYYAPSVAETVTIQISDGSGNATQTTITVGGTSTTTACSGTYSMNLDGTTVTMHIAVSDTYGNFIGNIVGSSGTAAIAGYCSQGTVRFLNQTSGSQYYGNAALTSNSKYQFAGTFTTTGGGSYPWYATQQ